MALQYSYQGKEISQNKNESRYKQTLYGTSNEVQTYRAGLIIGTFVSGKGYLTSWQITQKDANIWQIEVEYSTTFDEQISNEDSALIGKKSAQLSCRNLQMPLEHLSSYRACWNHYLLCNEDGASLPAWATTATDVILTAQQRQHYMWVKSLGEIPVSYGAAAANDQQWYVIQKPSKPGIQYYDLAYFVVTISAKYRSASDAGNAINKNINHITSPSQTFGITGGNWKLDEASVSYTGKYWLMTMVYTHSPDSWDVDIYGS